MNSFYFILALFDCALGFALILSENQWGWMLLFAAFCLSFGIKQQPDKLDK